RNVAQTNVTYKSLPLEVGKHGQRFLNRCFRWLGESSHPKIDDIEYIKSEISQVVVNGVDQLPTGKSMNQVFVVASASAHLGHDHTINRIGMECLLDDPIGYMRAIVVAGVNVVHAGLDRLAQNGNRGI